MFWSVHAAWHIITNYLNNERMNVRMKQFLLHLQIITSKVQWLHHMCCETNKDIYKTAKANSPALLTYLNEFEDWHWWLNEMCLLILDCTLWPNRRMSQMNSALTSSPSQTDKRRSWSCQRSRLRLLRHLRCPPLYDPAALRLPKNVKLGPAYFASSWSSGSLWLLKMFCRNTINSLVGGSK